MGARRSIMTLLFGIAATQARAQSSDTLVSRELAPGVSYRQFVDSRGPFVVYLVRVDVKRGAVELRVARPFDSLRGREKPTEMVKRAKAAGLDVLAATNADFFNLESGENENEQVIAGEWWKGLKVTDSPYDTYDNVHTQLAVDAAGRLSMGRFMLDARAWHAGVVTPIITLNFNPSGNPEGTALYTPRFGARTPLDSTRATIEAALIDAGLAATR